MPMVSSLVLGRNDEGMVCITRLDLHLFYSRRLVLVNSGGFHEVKELLNN